MEKKKIFRHFVVIALSLLVVIYWQPLLHLLCWLLLALVLSGVVLRILWRLRTLILSVLLIYILFCHQ